MSGTGSIAGTEFAGKDPIFDIRTSVPRQEKRKPEGEAYGGGPDSWMKLFGEIHQRTAARLTILLVGKKRTTTRFRTGGKEREKKDSIERRVFC